MNYWLVKPNRETAAGVSFVNELEWSLASQIMGYTSVLFTEAWQPRTVHVVMAGSVQGFVNMASLLTCDSQTWHTLKPYLENDVEALPVLLDDTPYFILNVFNIKGDYLDHERAYTKVNPYTPSGLNVLRYEFRDDLLQDRYLFRVPYDTEDVYATDAFRTLIEEKGIPNLHFWPHVGDFDRMITGTF